MNSNNNKSMLWPMIVAFAAGAATVLLSDEKNRKKVKEAFSDTLNKGTKLKDNALKTFEETAETGRRKIAKEMQKTATKLSS